MKNSRGRLPEAVRLLGRLADDCLSDADRARLLELLRSDPAARANYLDYIDLHVDLYWEHALAGDADEEMLIEAAGGMVQGSGSAPHLSSLTPHPFADLFSPLSSFSSVAASTLLSYLVAALLVGAGLLAAWTWSAAGVSRETAESGSPKPPVELARKVVGKISGMSGCQWADPKYAAQDPATVIVGREYILREAGLVEITYHSGTVVILEGPAHYVIESPNGGFLRYGKATVRVGRQRPLRPGESARDTGGSDCPTFSLRTPGIELLNQRGEFGISMVAVDQCAVTYAKVYRGAVRVKLPSENDDVISLNDDMSAWVKVDPKRIQLFYADDKMAPPIFARELPKGGPVYSGGTEGTPASKKSGRIESRDS